MADEHCIGLTVAKLYSAEQCGHADISLPKAMLVGGIKHYSSTGSPVLAQAGKAISTSAVVTALHQHVPCTHMGKAKTQLRKSSWSQTRLPDRATNSEEMLKGFLN